MKLLLIGIVSICFAGVSTNETAINNSKNPAEPENSISDVMKKAHGSKGLMKKALKGDATEEELKELVGLYVDMMDNEPPKGEAEDWAAASNKVVIAATRVMLGQEDAGDLLKEATNCKACHDAHK